MSPRPTAAGTSPRFYRQRHDNERVELVQHLECEAVDGKDTVESMQGGRMLLLSRKAVFDLKVFGFHLFLIPPVVKMHDAE